MLKYEQEQFRKFGYIVDDNCIIEYKEYLNEAGDSRKQTIIVTSTGTRWCISDKYV